MGGVSLDPHQILAASNSAQLHMVLAGSRVCSWWKIDWVGLQGCGFHAGVGLLVLCLLVHVLCGPVRNSSLVFM